MAQLVKNLPAMQETACNTRDPGSIPVLGSSPWSKEWQPTPVFLPGKSHGQRSLVGFRSQRVRHDMFYSWGNWVKRGRWLGPGHTDKQLDVGIWTLADCLQNTAPAPRPQALRKPRPLSSRGSGRVLTGDSFELALQGREGLPVAVLGAVPQAVGQHGAVASSSPPEWEPKPDVPLLQITITSHNSTVLMVIYCLCFFFFHLFLLGGG